MATMNDWEFARRAFLQDVLSEPVDPGSAPYVLLTGPGGSGKTVLLSELAGSSASRFTSVVRVNAHPSLGPDEIVVEVLSRHPSLTARTLVLSEAYSLEAYRHLLQTEPVLVLIDEIDGGPDLSSLIPPPGSPSLLVLCGRHEPDMSVKPWRSFHLPLAAPASDRLAQQWIEFSGHGGSAPRKRAEAHVQFTPATQLTNDQFDGRDLLGHEPHAEALAAFLRHERTQAPLVIGVHGPWGQGKSTFMLMVRRILDPKARETARRSGERLTNWQALRVLRQVRSQGAQSALSQVDGDSAVPDTAYPTVWFNPWMYQSGEQIWAGLAQEMVTQLTNRMSVNQRQRFWLTLNLSRVDADRLRRRALWALARAGAPLTAALAAGLATQLAEGAVEWIAGLGALVLGVTGGQRVRTELGQGFDVRFPELVRSPHLNQARRAIQGALADLGDLFARLDYSERVGFLHLVQSDLRQVVDLVGSPERPVVVFVDDLDRCTAESTVQVMEAINLFLAGEIPHCIFVLAMDAGIVANHLSNAYAGEQEVDPELGWRFLEKVVQLSLRVPRVPSTAVESYLRVLLTTGSLPAPDNAEAPAVAADDASTPRTDIHHPGPPSPYSRGEATPVDESDPTVWVALRTYADRFADNPRTLKRYVNTFRFYSHVAAMTAGTQGVVAVGDLAKLAALAVEFPRFNAYLLQAPETTLRLVEDAVATQTTAALDASLAEMLNNDDLVAFLNTEPKIGASIERLL